MLLHEERLDGVHPELVGVVKLSAELYKGDIIVLEGVRSREKQVQMVKDGRSKTLNGRHLVQKCGFGCAVDLAPMVDGQVSWHWPSYHKLAPFIKDAAETLGVPIEWGGDWKTFPDGPHWQLPWSEFP